MATVNPWSRFQSLLPKSQRYIITITSSHGDGTVSGTTREGDPVRVIGEGDPGARVWVEDGRVGGAAPALPGFVEYV